MTSQRAINTATCAAALACLALAVWHVRGTKPAALFQVISCPQPAFPRGIAVRFSEMAHHHRPPAQVS